jgi:polyhydroxyalkanoate synthesis regulator phasin
VDDDIVTQIGVELSWIEEHGTGALNDLDHAALLVALRDEIERLRYSVAEVDKLRQRISELEDRVSDLEQSHG